MNKQDIRQKGFGIACTVVWTELFNAMQADGMNPPDKCGKETRAWIEKTVSEYLAATLDQPPAERTKTDEAPKQKIDFKGMWNAISDRASHPPAQAAQVDAMVLGSKTFQREDRYLVIKKSHHNEDQLAALERLFDAWKIRTVQCVVVEADWPEHEPVWTMIGDRVNGTAEPAAKPTKLEDGMMLVPERFVKAASNYVRCATSGTRLSPYIKKNGLHGGSPWAEFVDEYAAMLTAHLSENTHDRA